MLEGSYTGMLVRMIDGKEIVRGLVESTHQLTFIWTILIEILAKLTYLSTYLIIFDLIDE